MHRYVIVTPAHNERAFIAEVFRSMCRQAVPPVAWIVVDDASTDGTGELLDRCAAERPDLLSVVHLRRPQGRDFGNKVRAFNAGLRQAESLDYDFIGNLDADISLEPDYFARLLHAFDQDPSLGVAGGMVWSLIEGRFVSQQVAPDSVAGAVQLFRRACFDNVGGYLPLPNGGVDAAAEIIARSRGWRVRTLPELRVLEHRRTGAATSRPLAARVREGRRLYALGYAFSFFLMRCVRRSVEQPAFVGSVAALVGYLWACARRDPRAVPLDVIRYLRREQRGKLLRAIGWPSFSRGGI
jgi:glycosyltransferase involved in cell wall biosynthesis